MFVSLENKLQRKCHLKHETLVLNNSLSAQKAFNMDEEFSKGFFVWVFEKFLPKEHI